MISALSLAEEVAPAVLVALATVALIDVAVGAANCVAKVLVAVKAGWVGGATYCSIKVKHKL